MSFSHGTADGGAQRTEHLASGRGNPSSAPGQETASTSLSPVTAAGGVPRVPTNGTNMSSLVNSLGPPIDLNPRTINEDGYNHLHFAVYGYGPRTAPPAPRISRIRPHGQYESPETPTPGPSGGQASVSVLDFRSIASAPGRSTGGPRQSLPSMQRSAAPIEKVKANGHLTHEGK